MKNSTPHYAKLWGTLSLVPALFITQPALADCALTSGSGTLSNPGNGAVINCTTSGGDHTTKIGSGTDDRSATITLQESATITNDSGNAIEIDSLTLTLGTGAVLETTTGGNHAIFSFDNSPNLSHHITLGDNARLSTTESHTNVAYIVGLNGDHTQTVILSGDNASITTQGTESSGVRIGGNNGDHTQTITLSGDGAHITTQGQESHGVHIANSLGSAVQTVTLTGAGAHITTNGVDANAIEFDTNSSGRAQAVITIGSDTSLISAQGRAINIETSGASGDSTVDSSGLIQAGTNSIKLGNGDDSLILRTGSNLDSTTGANLGGGTDTLTLVGNATEDELFLNIETVEVNADSTGWALTGSSSFTDVNVNTGRFTLGSGVSITNQLTIFSGAVLDGTGSTLTDVVNHGTMEPGNSIGTHTIAGNFTQGSSGALQIEVDAQGNHDFLDITGTATLDGTVYFSRDGDAPIADGEVYAFIDAGGGVTGSFATVSDDLLLVDFTVQTVGTEVRATAQRQTLATIADTQNERSVAHALDTAISNSDAGDIDAIINALSTTDSAQNLLASQSNVVTSSAIDSAGSAMSRVADIVQSRTPTLLHSTGLAGGDSNTESSYNYWAQAVAGYGEIDSNYQSKGVDYDIVGFAAGVERDLSDEATTLGIFTGFSETESDVKDLSDESSTQIYQIGVYGAHYMDNNWSFNGSLSGAYLDFETTRPTASGTAKADFDGYGAFGYGEAAYTALTNSTLTFAPYIGAQTAFIYHEDYNESGAGALNLGVEDKLRKSFSSEVGAQLTSTYHHHAMVFEPTLTLGWRHEFLDQSAQTNASFSNTSTTIFKSQGPEKARDSGVIGFDMTLTNTTYPVVLYTNYDGVLSSNAREHLFTAGIEFKW